MKCFGCFRRPKEKGEEDVASKQEAQEPSPNTPKSLAKQQSLAAQQSDKTLQKRNSLQSTQSVYFDCQEPPDGPNSSLRSEDSFDKDGQLRQSSEANGQAPASRGINKLLAGSLRVGEQKGSVEGISTYEQADPTGFMVRGKDYMKTKQKVKAQGEVYRLIGCDIYSFDQKIHHIAQFIELPVPPRLSDEHRKLPKDQQLPPLLIINIQLPTYKTGMIPGRGSTDGKGVHIVQYFGLPEDFCSKDIGNEAALGLLQRLVSDGKEENRDKTRDRLKLIARVVNVDEWAEKAPLSGYEHGLLKNYNDKPILTRPQHKFFRGETYLEIDLDVHSYAWAARKALSGFIPRLGTVVFEDALIIQGNSPDELPEVVMACARVSHLELTNAKPFPAKLFKKNDDFGEVSAEDLLQCNTFPDDAMSADAHSQGSDDHTRSIGSEDKKLHD